MSRYFAPVANSAGAVYRAAVNLVLAALRSSHSGSGRHASPIVGQLNHDTDNDELALYGNTGWRALAYADSVAKYGYDQCQLTLTGGNLKLSRYRGLGFILINGTVQQIPAGGVTLAPTGATPDTTYYIYVYMNGTTMTLERSTTGYTLVEGMPVKTGDNSRTLVGMARPIAGPVWVNTNRQQFVRSWFNDPGLYAIGINTTQYQNDNYGAGFVETNVADRAEWISFAEEWLYADCYPTCRSDSATGATFGLKIDGNWLCKDDASGYDSTFWLPRYYVSVTSVSYAQQHMGDRPWTAAGSGKNASFFTPVNNPTNGRPFKLYAGYHYAAIFYRPNASGSVSAYMAANTDTNSPNILIYSAPSRR